MTKEGQHLPESGLPSLRRHDPEQDDVWKQWTFIDWMVIVTGVTGIPHLSYMDFFDLTLEYFTVALPFGFHRVTTQVSRGRQAARGAYLMRQISLLLL